MHKRIYAFLEKYEILYELQFGFRTEFSTIHALIHMTEKIRHALDAGKVSCGIFIDLQKAFDTVNHDILIEKLRHYIIQDKTVSIFQFSKTVSITKDYSKWCLFG